MVSYFTEELALRTGEALGGILNALLGNVTVILIGSFALFRREMVLVKSYMAGTIAFKMVLVLGACR
jgi:Ca2+:H+ antiporter